MFEYIKKLQKRSVKERNRAALIFACTLTVFIFIIWLTTLPFQKSEVVTSTENIDLAPLENIKGGLSELFLNFREAKETIDKIRDGTIVGTTSDNSFENNEASSSAEIIFATTTESYY